MTTVEQPDATSAETRAPRSIVKLLGDCSLRPACLQGGNEYSVIVWPSAVIVWPSAEPYGCFSTGGLTTRYLGARQIPDQRTRGRLLRLRPMSAPTQTVEFSAARNRRGRSRLLGLFGVVEDRRRSSMMRLSSIPVMGR